MKQMREKVESGRGMAPQPRHFKRQSMLAVLGLDEDDLKEGAPAMAKLGTASAAFGRGATPP